MTAPRKPTTQTRVNPKRPKPAVQVEADRDETVDFDARGVTLTVPASPDHWPYEAIHWMRKGDPVAFFDVMIDPDKLGELFALRPRFTQLEWADLLESIAKRWGFTSLGE